MSRRLVGAKFPFTQTGLIATTTRYTSAWNSARGYVLFTYSNAIIIRLTMNFFTDISDFTTFLSTNMKNNSVLGSSTADFPPLTWRAFRRSAGPSRWSSLNFINAAATDSILCHFRSSIRLTGSASGSSGIPSLIFLNLLLRSFLIPPSIKRCFTIASAEL